MCSPQRISTPVFHNLKKSSNIKICMSETKEQDRELGFSYLAGELFKKSALI
jgi:hypothetical protein